MSRSVSSGNLGNRNRRVQSELRKQQIIEATLDSIDHGGLSQLSLDKIAQKAGITKGNLVFHFNNRENLLEQTLHFLNQEYLDCWQGKLDSAGNNPTAQIKALIDARFSSRICSRKKISIWYAFWGESRSRPGYQKVCGQSDKAYSDALIRCCSEIKNSHGGSLDAATAAQAIEGMIDGLWQDMLISSQPMKRRDAAAAVHRLVDALFPDIKNTNKR